MDPVAPTTHLSDLEALMWTLEKDPHLSSWVGNLSVFDRPVDHDVLRARLEGAAAAIPRLRQHIAPTLGRLVPPEWRDAPDFTLDHHVRRVAVPSPGDDAALAELVADLNAAPMDRSRPLWEFIVIEGLEGGRSAMLQRLHHTITDGEGGIRMAEQFVDLERDADGPLRPPVPVPTDDPDRDLVGMAAGTVGHLTRRGLGMARRTVGSGVSALRDPGSVGSAATAAAETAQAVVAQLRSDRARSPLWTERSLDRAFTTLRVPFRPAKAAARALGGSVNDLFVAGVAGGIGAHHAARGAAVDELRMAMPVSTRASGAAGNAFTPLRVLIPTAIADPRERFGEIHDRLAVTKSDRSLGAVDGLAGVLNLLPTALIVRVARAQTETIDFATSNVRGAPFATYMAGAKLLATYPLGPIVGTAVNVTTISYDGSLDLGIHVDRGAVGDPAPLTTAIATAFDELLAAA